MRAARRAAKAGMAPGDSYCCTGDTADRPAVGQRTLLLVTLQAPDRGALPQVRLALGNLMR
tara:strand:+ start:342 stop:524 length:183 start_codon:yes stop_codon:yes gene_type:complete